LSWIAVITRHDAGFDDLAGMRRLGG